MSHTEGRDRLLVLAEQSEDQSWADYGSQATKHPLLTHYIASYTYSVGELKEHDSKLITRAYPTLMTQLYFEFHGGLSEIHGENHGFGQHGPVCIGKRSYVKLGLGGWFDIYQVPSTRQARPIKNLKIELYPNALHELFNLSPNELLWEDLQLPDLVGARISSLILEEMESAQTGQEMVEVAERYLLDHIITQNRLKSKSNTPCVPELEDRLDQLARRTGKSERWLQKRYRDVCGMTFKQMQSNVRFHKAHHMLWATLSKGQALSLSQLACDCGYYDQPHFIKDFRRYTGMTPTQYLQQNLNQERQYLWYW
ncbi:AraC family transcriptional regulator [Ectothiorhodospira marina]|uniref:AraC-type DNA-binding protein n=1 Tax=Ectothiorhodospira marina TaxID=1396821 RepID=A0A1H7PTH3_9GAMM|nr:helix-turn-helix domain-containing protein [Ectothiorhodospira marina]SEL38555.1 AraC-type DNA-binding protein [Ectothiorhodospira marina]